MQEATWWQHAIIYEVYPRSFQDSNGDGVGDLNGILQRLDYLVELKIDAVWISPIYLSPMEDFGYDVADYCNIDPIFGSMEDFDRLLTEMHRRGLKVILDFVPNHTSDRHSWFLESRSSRTSAKRDWYLWRDPPPNNWLSNFGGSGWAWDEATGQYYYHSFLKQQPDLNWRNPAVRTAMFEALRFWLDRGVDGFRVDVMWLMIKDDLFRDNPPNPGYRLGTPSSHRLLPVFNSNRPEVHEVVAQMRAVLESYQSRVLIGEIYLPVAQLVTYYGEGLKGAQLPFNFQLLQTVWRADEVARVITEYESALPPDAWPNWVMGNHDKSRIATRVGVRQARVAAMLLLTLRGTPTMYYGEEIGMTDVSIPPEQVQDPAEKNEPGIGAGRDPERTPMPWDDSPHAGFSTSKPWLPLGSDYATVNVAAMLGDNQSILTLYRRLIALRRSRAALLTGQMRGIIGEKGVLRYRRVQGKERLLVVLNMGHETAEVEVPPGTVLLSTWLDREAESVGGVVALRAAEGLVIELADCAEGAHD
jgi:alpha-glucosidase